MVITKTKSKYIMDEILRKIYYNPKSGFLSFNQLFSEVKKEFPNISRKEVKIWYDKQISNQRAIQPNRKVEYHKIIGDGTSYQGDIMFLENPKNNNGFIGMLTFINNSTRYAYVFPIKTNKTEEILANLHHFVEQLDENITNITTDNEFYNNIKIKNFFEDNDIEQYVEYPNVHSKLAIINRFHRTLRGLLNKYFISYDTDRWIDIIDDIIYNYNHRINSGIGKQPAEMTEGDVKNLNKKLQEETKSTIKKFNKFKIGDVVRHLDGRRRFDKGPRRYSDGIFVIDSIDGLSFSLKNVKSGLPAPRTYRYHELKKVEEPLEPPQLIEKPPKRQTDKQKTIRRRRIREMRNLDIPTDEYGHPL